MEKIIIKGYAQLEPGYDLQRYDARVWYIPHHGVYRPHKRDKMGLCSIAQLSAWFRVPLCGNLIEILIDA